MHELLRKQVSYLNETHMPGVMETARATFDAAFNDESQAQWQAALTAAFASFATDAAKKLDRIAADQGKWHTKEWRRAVEAAIGVDIKAITAPADIRAALDAQSLARAEMIRKASRDLSADVARATVNALRSAQTHRELAQHLSLEYNEALHGKHIGRTEASRERNMKAKRALLRRHTDPTTGTGKPMRYQSRYELIARTQMANARAALDQTRQQQAGITKYRWKTAADERVRSSHAAREGQTFTWAKPPSDGHPGHPPNCVPGSTEVVIGHGVKALTRHEFRGHLACIVTSEDDLFEATPNHPVLTQRGWVPAGGVKIGDYLFRYVGEVDGAGPSNKNTVKAKIGDVFEAASELGVCHSVDAASANFHGDVPDSDVDIVDIDGQLLFDVVSDGAQSGGDFHLALANGLPAVRGPLEEFSPPAFDATDGVMGGGGAVQTLLGRHLSHADLVGLARTAEGHPGLAESLGNDATGNANGVREGEDAFATEVAGDDVVSIEIDALAGAPFPGHYVAVRVNDVSDRAYEGHVYNLQNATGTFIAHGLLTHNCRCYAEGILDELE